MTHVQNEATASPGDATQTRAALRPFYLAAWRWHFYAGLYVIPFLVMLAVTGLIMLWVAVLDGREGGAGFIVTPSQEAIPVSAQAEAALAAQPGTLRQYIAPSSPEGAALFRVEADTGPMMVAVDPYTGEALEVWPRRAGLYDLASDIHGTLLIGDFGDRLIEIAAGLALILIVTGLYLWWPREVGLGRALVPNLSARGRPLWRSLHQTIGVYISVLLVLFLLSGLAWAGIWGGKFVQAWSTFPAEKWEEVPLSDMTHADLNTGATKEVPWGLEQTPLPASGSEAGTGGIAPGTAVNIDTVVAFAGTLGFGADGRFQLNLPDGPTGVWTLSQDSMSGDTPNPTDDRTVHIDQYTGNVLADVGFADYSAGAKAMAVGIAFHEGDMGVWNIVLNTVFCLAVIFVSVSGAVMWWLRRPAGVARLAAPPMPANLPLWKGAVFLMLLLSLAFPLTGLTLLAILALDLLVLRHVPVLKRAFQ